VVNKLKQAENSPLLPFFPIILCAVRYCNNNKNMNKLLSLLF